MDEAPSPLPGELRLRNDSLGVRFACESTLAELSALIDSFCPNL